MPTAHRTASQKNAPAASGDTSPGALVPRELRLDADAAMLAWARGIARGVCQDVHTRLQDARFHIGSDAELELEGTALVTLARLMNRFDESRLPPGGDLVGAFRGYASKWIRKECRREAERVRNGGLYRTTAGAAVTVGPLPISADGEEEITDPVSLEEEDLDGTTVPMHFVTYARRTRAGRAVRTTADDTRAQFAAWRAARKAGQ